MIHFLIIFAISLGIISTLLLLYCFYSPKTDQLKTVNILVVVGSGGHTREILTLVSKLGCHYTPRHYIIANTDKISEKKINSLESTVHSEDDSGSKNKYSIHHIPRSREVSQSWITTVLSTTYATIFAFPLVFSIKPRVILCNGPGTCIPLCLAGLVLKMLNFGKTKVIYIESICRVETLSLSAKILYFLADDILVQWPHLQKQFPRTKYIGRLV